ncbi:MAG: glycoside hydrolase family 9 protein [Proteobacteria bacterium]|nr:glycoside hydrolase family 9 protein [Pseudomonadota bacterium]
MQPLLQLSVIGMKKCGIANSIQVFSRIIFFSLWFVALISQQAASATAAMTSTEVFPVSSSLISLSLTSPPLVYGKLVSFTRKAADNIETDGNGNIWLLQNGRKIGAVVGPRQEHLFRFPGNSLELAVPSILDKATSYTLSSEDDLTYRQPVSVEEIGRKSRPIDSVWDSTGLQIRIEHTMYMRLSSPLRTGMTYRLTLPPLLNVAPVTFVYQPENMVSSALHINQLGFRPDAPVKQTFLSLWAGSLGPIDFTAGTPFYLVDETNGTKVFSAPLVLKKSLSDQNEDAYGKNYTGANIYLLNFSSFTVPGTYHIFVDGVGRSPSFEIKDRIWRRPLYQALRSFYHQRSGIALTAPFTTFQRSRALHPDDGLQIFTSKARLMDTGNGFIEGLDNFSKLNKLASTIPIKNAWGGYHDAGDWDRRIQHLLLTRNLLDLYALFPEFFSTLKLNIPDSGNDLPDALDEALWPLDFFCRLQEADGSMRGGIEATGHPFFGEPSWLERHQLLAYSPDIWSTYLFAATAAHAARTLSSLAPERAEDYGRRALLAMRKAEELLDQDRQQPLEVNDARNLAAIELFRLTNDSAWHKVFLDTTAFLAPGIPLARDEHHDQGEAAWSYLQAPAKMAKAEIRANCRGAIFAAADSLIADQEKAGFSWLKAPWRPPFAGAFTIPFTRDVIRAWLLTGKPQYLEAVERSLQFTLGANPLNLSYTTGLGSTAVQHPYYPDARISGQNTPAGITVLGPLDLSFIGDAKNELLQSYGNFCYPDIRKWPVMETYLDVFWFPLMNEFSLETMANQLYSWGFLAAYPTKKSRKQSLHE